MLYRYADRLYREGSTIPDIIPDEQDSRLLEQQILRILLDLRDTFGPMVRALAVGRTRLSQDPIRWAKDLLDRIGSRDRRLADLADQLDDLAELLNLLDRLYPYTRHQDY